MMVQLAGWWREMGLVLLLLDERRAESSSSIVIRSSHGSRQSDAALNTWKIITPWPPSGWSVSMLSIPPTFRIIIMFQIVPVVISAVVVVMAQTRNSGELG